MSAAFQFVEGNPEHDFWEQNPQLRYFDQTKKLIEDIGEEKASKVMWAVFLLLDTGSKFRTIDYEERKKIISDNYLNDSRFNWEEFNYLIDAYPEMAMSPAQQIYKVLYDKFNDAVRQIKNSDISDDREFAKFVALFSKLDTMFKGLATAEDRYKQEKAVFIETRGQQQSGFFGKKQK